MVVNRHIHGSQQAHGLYVAIVQAYKRYRDGNKKEQKWKSIDTINRMIMTHSLRTQNIKRQEYF